MLVFGRSPSALVRLMQAAFDIAVEYVHDRKQFGQAVGEFQLIQGRIGFHASAEMSLLTQRVNREGCGHVHEAECLEVVRLRRRESMR